MKTKIQIKTWGGTLLFEHETTDNSVKKTLEKAVAERADLKGAYLEGADLEGAYLEGVWNLPSSYVNICSRDMIYIFTLLKLELPFLREKLVNGEIDGTVYEGKCACLIGSLGKGTSEGVSKVCKQLPYYEKGLHNPAEQWFYQIREGDKPKDNIFAAHALELIDGILKQS